MATTADQVQVVLSAQTTKYLRDIKSAEQLSSREFAKIEAEVEALGRQIGVSLAQGGGGLETFSKDVQKTAAATKFNTANIAAQFQDIGVTAAAGMSPLQIALQQGTQLSAILNESVGRGVNPVKALGGAFVQILNPISLATIAAIALGTTLLQSLGSILPASETANQALKRHREELENIVRGYGAAEDAINEYFDAVDRLPQGIATAQTQAAFAKLGQEVTAFTAEAERVSAVFDKMSASGGEAATKAAELSGQFARGQITAEDFYTGMVDLRESLSAFDRAATLLPGSLGNLINSMIEGSEKAIAFGNAINNLVAASQALAGTAVDTDLQNALDLSSYIAEQERINGLTSDQLALEKEIARIKADAGELGITDQRAKQLAEETLAAEKRRADIQKQLTAGNKAGNKAATEYERERQAVLDLMEAMGFHAALLGQSNREKAIAIALSKANATATEEERNSIAQTAAYIYDTEQAIKDLNATSIEWANTIQSATRSFIDDLIEGKSAAEAFSNVLSSIANKLLDVGLDNLFGSKGFNIAGLFGGTSTRATGGPVYAGNPTLVGERGPELFIPSTPGKIVPNSQTGGGGVTFAPVIDARGADVAAIARLEQVVQRLAADTVPTIRREMATANKKGRTRG